VSSDRYKEMWEDAFHDNLEKKAEISELKAEVARLKAEVERLTEDNQQLQARLDFLEDPRS
jgi:cell division protein FtsB